MGRSGAGLSGFLGIFASIREFVPLRSGELLCAAGRRSYGSPGYYRRTFARDGFTQLDGAQPGGCATTSEEVTPACSSMKLEVLALPKEILRVFFKSLPLLGGCQEAALRIAMLDPFAWSTTLDDLDHLVEGVTPVRSAISLSLAKLLIYERLALRKLALLGSSCFRALPR